MAETDRFQPQVVTPGAQPQPDQQDQQPDAPAGPERPADAQAPLDTGTAFKPETDQSGQIWDSTAAPDGAPDFGATDEEPAITWTASEFIAHHKTPAWFGSLAGITAAVSGLVYLLTRDVISAGIVVFAAVLFGIAAARQPRQLEYELNSRGIQIGARHYRFDGFRCFSVVPEGGLSSIIFMPMKRFAPLITIYFDSKDEHRIVNLLNNSLPFEDYKHDPIDQLMHRIRF